MSSLLFSLSLSLEREREQQSATRALFYTEDIFPTNETKEEKEKKKQRKKLFRVLNPKCVVVSFLPLARNSQLFLYNTHIVVVVVRSIETRLTRIEEKKKTKSSVFVCLCFCVFVPFS